MSKVLVATNFNIDIEFTAPSFGRRLLSWIIDMVVLVFYVVVAIRLYASLLSNVTEDAGVIDWAVRMVLILPFILYHLVLEATMHGQSIGKKITGIRVVSENGGRPSLGQLIIRWAIRTGDYMLIIIVIVILSLNRSDSETWAMVALPFLLLLVDLVLVNTRKQQRLGDVLAHTVLIDTKQKGKLTDTVFLEVSNEYVPQFPQIMRLSDRDMNALKGIIDAVRKHNDYNMAYTAAEKIKSHLNIQTHLEPQAFLEILLKDYNYLSVN